MRILDLRDLQGSSSIWSPHFLLGQTSVSLEKAELLLSQRLSTKGVISSLLWLAQTSFCPTYLHMSLLPGWKHCPTSSSLQSHHLLAFSFLTNVCLSLPSQVSYPLVTVPLRTLHPTWQPKARHGGMTPSNMNREKDCSVDRCSSALLTKLPNILGGWCYGDPNSSLDPT